MTPKEKGSEESDYQESLNNSNRTGVEFALTDLDLALVFLDVAATSTDSETVRRNHENARTAYTTVVDLLEKLSLDGTQRQEVETKLAVVRARLSLL
jgi:hypothetical protein